MEDTIKFIYQIFWVVVLIVEIGAFWTLFKKAGQPGWAILIPIYNLYVMLKIADKPGWWIVLLFVPIVNIVWSLVMTILMCVSIATNFGKGTGFAIGLIFLPFIFIPILAFGNANYLSVPGSPAAGSTNAPQFTPANPAVAQGWRS
ncbi:MAG: hypothetical protein JW749_09575 [Sedimentisphaerales bacterium]|nr:hypothetical protein [Sedimentisphaerales bacterium]